MISVYSTNRTVQHTSELRRRNATSRQALVFATATVSRHSTSSKTSLKGTVRAAPENIVWMTFPRTSYVGCPISFFSDRQFSFMNAFMLSAETDRQVLWSYMELTGLHTYSMSGSSLVVVRCDEFGNATEQPRDAVHTAH